MEYAADKIKLSLMNNKKELITIHSFGHEVTTSKTVDNNAKIHILAAQNLFKHFLHKVTSYRPHYLKKEH